MKISPTTKITKIVDKYPKLASILMEKYNLHCIGCGSAQFETLAQGARSHGMKTSEISEMIKELNKISNF